MPEFMNLETGEIVDYEEMLRQYEEEYDGFDDTNPCGLDEYFERIS